MSTTASNNKKFWVTLLAAGTLWAGLGIGTAFAEIDAKDYPATFCRPSAKFKFGVSGGITIYNKSTLSPLTVYCPIIRDLMSRDAKMQYVLVKYYNPYFKDRQVSCQLRKLTPNGKITGQSKATRGTAKTPGGTIMLKIPRSGLTTKGEANYVVTCKLPASGGRSENQKVKLSGYTAREKD